MGGLRAHGHALRTLVRGVDGQPLAAAGAAADLRLLHIAAVLPPCVEPQREAVRTEQTLQDGLRMGERRDFRHDCGDAGTPVRIPDVRDSHLVDGTLAAGGRLPLREQGDLRTADAQHAAVVPVRTPHDAVLANQEIVFRSDPLGLSPAQGTAQDKTQRRSSLQLPGGRHGTT